MKKCPYCAEDIKDEAIVCKHCGKVIRSESERKIFSCLIAIMIIVSFLFLIGSIIFFIIAMMR